MLGELSQLMAYFGYISRQLLESLHGVKSYHPDLIKVRTSHKDYGNNKSVDFCYNISENHQFYPVHAKIILFYFVLFIYTECGNKAAYCKDVLRFHLFRKYFVPKKAENSQTCILQSLKPEF